MKLSRQARACGPVLLSPLQEDGQPAVEVLVVVTFKIPAERMVAWGHTLGSQEMHALANPANFTSDEVGSVLFTDVIFSRSLRIT